MSVANVVIAAVLGYLIGSFPTGVLVTRLLGKPDVRFSGSGHTGGRNAYRQAGLLGGLITAFGDVGKGLLAAWLALRLTGVSWALPVAGVTAIVGHCWSVYIGFSGGMGLGTMAGLFFWWLPAVPFVGAALWGLLYLVLRDIPRSVMLMTILMVPVFWLLNRLGHASPEVTVLGIAGLGVLFIRHLTQLREYARRSPGD